MVLAMHDKPPDRTDVESKLCGDISFFFTGSERWLSDAQQWANAVQQTILQMREYIPACVIVRLVVVANDVPQEVRRWQAQLGQAQLPLDEASGMVAGKTFVWGDGEPDTTFGVVIIRETLAAEILEKGELPSVSRATLVHEFAHVHDDFMRLRQFGPETNPKCDDWAGIRHSIALFAWTEYFAELTSCREHPDGALQNSVSLAKDLTCRALECIDDAKAQYHEDRNMGLLWSVACDELSKVFNQFARAIGLATGLGENLTEEALRSVGIESVWNEMLLELQESLRKIESLDGLPAALSKIENIIESGFNNLGLYPEPEGGRLRVRVFG